ncbi:hypothetical protein LSH36_126g00029 [Paralvinella palmiformis]|uniref:Uncharacterized protein n=1 Tax=Paralvinella palmiformis TaxID=53620 RepID=A0AAD9JWW6_9ANNE|nr:hypothetical protein LSH36_126g00029 [Paralvinella palmiformis]
MSATRRLQDNLEKINNNIIFLNEKHEQLEAENAILHPERDAVRELHEDIITQLNHRMAEKATKQIVLNETRDKLRETNHKIVDLEEGIIQLKEDLIQERADARMEKKRLKKAVSIRRFEASKARMETQEKILQELKQELALKAEDAARLRQENMDMEQRIEELSETHESIVATFQKQIAEMRAQLTKERKERLQQQIRDDEASIKHLEQQLEASRTDLDFHQEQRRGEIKQMEEDIVAMSEKLKETEDIILDKTPSFVELQEYYEQRIEEYDKLKKHVVEDGMTHATRELGKLSVPTEKLRAQLEARRSESMAQLKEYSTERTDIEKQVYTTGSKLRTAMEENHNFIQSNQNFESWIRSLEKEIIDSDQLSKNLESQLQSLKDSLSIEWDKDNDIQKMFAARDEALVKDLGKLLSTTERREQTISNITMRLDEELTVLGEFLDNVAKRRPKESSKGRRTAKSSRGYPSAKSNVHTPRSPRSAKSPTKQLSSKRDDQTVAATDVVLSNKLGQNKSVTVLQDDDDDSKSSNTVVPSTISYPVLSPIPPSTPQP